MIEFSSLHNEEQIYKSEDFSKKYFGSHSFTCCVFQTCNFSESLLQNAKFFGCTFVGCNLSLVKLDNCRLQDAQFIDCKIVGADFCRFQKTFFSASFKNTLLHYCNFSDLNMKNNIFSGSRVKESYFSNTCLTGADFSDVDLSGTIFHNCDLCKADFSTATQYEIDPLTNKIKKAKFSLPEAVGLLRAFDIVII